MFDTLTVKVLTSNVLKTMAFDVFFYFQQKKYHCTGCFKEKLHPS